MNRSVTTAAAPPRVGHYPPGRRGGPLLFLSGLGPRPAGGGAIPGVTLGEDGTAVAWDIEAQVHAVFANTRAVLEAAGSGWDRLVDVTVFLTDIRRDFPIITRLGAEYFPQDPPCRTTVEVNRLPTPIAIELKCIATVEP
jgi:2-aminomuconate deaminase